MDYAETTASGPTGRAAMAPPPATAQVPSDEDASELSLEFNLGGTAEGPSEQRN
jgi:hypothetical protein